MKPKEFYKIMEEFVKEDKRWRALKVDDIVYEERCAGMEFEYCKMVINKINLEEREVIAHDVNSDAKFNYRALDNFLTEEEFNKLHK